MSLLVLGASHRTASVDALEALAAGTADPKLRRAAVETPYVREAVVLTTCNRIEVYASVERFHGAVDDLTALLSERAPDIAKPDLVAALYVHYDTGAVAHLFAVAAGLDSLVVGEQQILGQVREALRTAQDDGTVGPELNALFQHSLRVGKRAHAETSIDEAGRSMVTVALESAAALLGPLDGARVCVVGAGTVATLAVGCLRRAGARDIAVLSRTRDSAGRLGVDGAARIGDLSRLAAEVAAADLVVCCTGATDLVLDRPTLSAATEHRAERPPLVVVDLALPRDVDPAAGDLPGVRLIGLPEIAAASGRHPAAAEVAAVEDIVAGELAAFDVAREHDRVTPTVVALRSMATGVIAAEIERLQSRLPELTPQQRSEVAGSLRRVADKLLHQPTVQVKRLAGRVPEPSYDAALASLFALDPTAVRAVSGGGDQS